MKKNNLIEKKKKLNLFFKMKTSKDVLDNDEHKFRIYYILRYVQIVQPVSIMIQKALMSTSQKSLCRWPKTFLQLHRKWK